MSEPNLAYSSLAAEIRPSDGKSTLDAEAVDAAGTIFETIAPQSLEPLQQYLDLWAAEHHEIKVIDPEFIAALKQQATAALESQQQQWEHEQETLRAELRQARSLSHEQSERIRHLEQALDQSLASLSEMQRQVVNQHLLEAQLASTEEISNIQQQAIGRLKLQLVQQQQALTAQLTETQARDRALQTLLNTMEALTQAQQQTLTQLQAQIVHDRADVEAYQQRLEVPLEHLQADLTAQQRTLALETSSLEVRTLAEPLGTRLEPAHAQVRELSQILSDRQIALKHLEAELQQAHRALQEQQALLDRLQQSRLPRPSATGGIAPAPSVLEPGTSAIAAELITAQAKIAALEAQAAKQTTAQAMLRHACQELEEERDRQQARMADLESQSTDMQEQILRQAQQASEYETAIQHWKDRCFSSQNDVLNLKALLEQALPNLPADVSDVLAALLAAADETTEPSSPALLKTTTFSREPKVDLPDFLIRRRNHKTRRS